MGCYLFFCHKTTVYLGFVRYDDRDLLTAFKTSKQILWDNVVRVPCRFLISELRAIRCDSLWTRLSCLWAATVGKRMLVYLDNQSGPARFHLSFQIHTDMSQFKQNGTSALQHSIEYKDDSSQVFYCIPFDTVSFLFCFYVFLIVFF